MGELSYPEVVLVTLLALALLYSLGKRLRRTRCARCRELILRGATVCPHCRSVLR